jgi:predicted transcriptional regulator
MADSKAVSIRIPDELLAKIDKLAEEKYTSIKGKPNRSLVIQSAIVAYFVTVSDTVSDDATENNLITLSDSIDIVEFKGIQKSVTFLLDELQQLKKTVSTLSGTVIKPEIEIEQKTRRQLELMPIATSVSTTVSDNVNEGLTINQLSERLDCSTGSIKKEKYRYKNEPKKFVTWSRKRDHAGFGWEFRQDSDLFYRVQEPASLSEGEAEAQTNHP